MFWDRDRRRAKKLARRKRNNARKRQSAVGGHSDARYADDLPAHKFSYWTGWHKLALASVAAVVLGAGSVGAYSCASEVIRRDAYERRVEDHIRPYRSAPQHTLAASNCLRPGSRAHVFRAAMLNRDNPYNEETLVVTDGLRNRLSDMGEDEPMLCIRPVDGGQDMDLESRITVRGLDHGSIVDGSLRRAGLRIMHGVPGIFSPSAEVSSLRVNGKEVPLSYLELRDPDGQRREQYHYLDIASLVQDRIIGSDDLEGGLDISMEWSVGFDRIESLDVERISPRSAYHPAPKHITGLIQSTEEFPAANPRIRQVVGAYGGDRDDVSGIMRYTMDYVDDTLTYFLPGNHDVPVPDLITKGRGNCLDYARLYVTILRSFGIPSRLADASVLQTAGGISLDGLHAWAEVYVPFDDGSERWIVVEPTWADDRPAPYTYINFVTNRYLYNLDVRAELDTGASPGRYELFQEHDLVSTAREYEAEAFSSEEGTADGEEDSDDCFDCVTYMHGDAGVDTRVDGGVQDGG